jgi:hypothetical protein
MPSRLSLPAYVDRQSAEPEGARRFGEELLAGSHGKCRRFKLKGS